MLSIEVHDNMTDFVPGAPIDGVLSWSFDNPPKAIELRLFWYTQGKGTRDTGVCEVVRYDNPQNSDAQIFSLQAPPGPLSFDGRLIAIQWMLEAVTYENQQGAAQLPITIRSH